MLFYTTVVINLHTTTSYFVLTSKINYLGFCPHLCMGNKMTPQETIYFFLFLEDEISSIKLLCIRKRPFVLNYCKKICK